MYQNKSTVQKRNGNGKGGEVVRERKQGNASFTNYRDGSPKSDKKEVKRLKAPKQGIL